MGWGYLGEELGDQLADLLSPLGGVGVVGVQAPGELQRHDLKVSWGEAEWGWVGPARPGAAPPGRRPHSLDCPGRRLGSDPTPTFGK